MLRPSFRDRILFELFNKFNPIRSSIDSFNEFFNNSSVTSGFQTLLNSFTQNNRILLKNVYGEPFVYIDISNSNLKGPSYRLEIPTRLNSFDEIELTSVESILLSEETYEGRLYILVRVYDLEDNLISKDWILFGMIPILLGSSFSHSNQSSNYEGAFIVNGIFKSLITLEKADLTNPLYNKKGYKLFPEENNYYNTLTFLGDNPLNYSFSFRGKRINLINLLQTIDLTDRQINSILSLNGFSEETIEALYKTHIHTIGNISAREYLINLFLGVENLEETLTNLYVIFNLTNNRNRNILLADRLVDLLAEYIERSSSRDYTNLDILANKTLVSPILLIERTLSRAISKFIDTMEVDLMKRTSIRRETLIKYIQRNSLEPFIRQLFLAGISPGHQARVIQTLDLINPISTHSHLLRTVLDINELQVTTSLRTLNPTHYNKYCLIETPDGKSIGIRRNLANFTLISQDFAINDIIANLTQLLDYNLDNLPTSTDNLIRITFNNILLGYVTRNNGLIDEILKINSKSKYYSYHLGFTMTRTALKITSSAGRILSLYLNLRLRPTRLRTILEAAPERNLVNYLISKQVFVFLDPHQERHFRVTNNIYQDVRFCPNCSNTINQSFQEGCNLELLLTNNLVCTSCNYEIHLRQRHQGISFDFAIVSSLQVLGLTAATIPLLDNSPSARGLYGVSLTKQSIGVQTPSFHTNLLSKTNRLLDVHAPVVTTSAIESLLIPSSGMLGQNTVIAIGGFENANLYDAVVISEEALQRGLFRSYLYTIESETLLKPTPDLREEFRDTSQSENINLKENPGRYENLNLIGFRNSGSVINFGDVLFSKEIQIGSGIDIKRTDSPITYTYLDQGVIEANHIINKNNQIKIRAKIRRLKIPGIGDKFASRNGQKGVLSRTFRTSEIYYTASGITPDLIINPHSIGARMTMSTILEGVFGKAAVYNLRRYISDPFNMPSITEAQQTLINNGVEASGSEITYSHLGYRLSNPVFFGINYYYRTHHIASEKAFFRDKGKVQALTRQPTEGRNKGGGLRLGEMERDCLVAYGVTHTIYERFIENSDAIEVYVCQDCQEIIASSMIPKNSKCFYCGGRNLVLFKTLYGLLLFIQELEALGIAFKIRLNDLGEIESTKFKVLNNEEILLRSKVMVISGEVYYNKIIPVKGGVLDSHLGVVNYFDKCETCGLGVTTCLGHSGHIVLATPVVHFLFEKIVVRVLNAICHFCASLFRGINNSVMTCRSCERNSYKVSFNEKDLEFVQKINNVKTVFEDEAILTLFNTISIETARELGFEGESHPRDLIIENFLIPPINIRPTLNLPGNEQVLDDLSSKLIEIVTLNSTLKSLLASGAPYLSVNPCKKLLKFHIATYFNNANRELPVAAQRSGKPIVSIAERISGKTGRIRGNLFGKRMNYSGRAVITVNSDLQIDEVGVPEYFLNGVTILRQINELNIEQIRNQILNEDPEILEIIKESGNQFFIMAFNKQVIAENLSVTDQYRTHVRDGDRVLFNRQPSLHKLSILSLIVRKVAGTSLQLHPALCLVFNADFDGDEMNIHFLQSFESQLESTLLMSPQVNLISPKTSRTNFGLVQDSILNFFLLASTNRIFTLSEVCILLEGTHTYRRIQYNPQNQTYTLNEIISHILPTNFTFYYENEGREIFNIENGIVHTFTFLNRYLAPGALFFNRLAVYETENYLDIVQNFYILSQRIATFIVPTLSLDQQIIIKAIRNQQQGTNFTNQEIEENHSNNDTFKLFSCGTKGSMYNFHQMYSQIGGLYYRQLPLSNNKNLPITPLVREYEFDPFINGHISRPYVFGLDPISFFFNTIPSRDGLIDRAIGTATTGYLQRKLVFSLEDIVTNLRGSVITSSNHLIQPFYGDTGLNYFFESPVQLFELTLNEFITTRELFQREPIDNLVVSEQLFREARETNVDLEPLIVFFRQPRVREFVDRLNSTELPLILNRFFDSFTLNKISTKSLVGIMAAQSLGEPISQMTMRTFQSLSGSGLNLEVATVLRVLEQPKAVEHYQMKFQIRPEYNNKESIDRVITSLVPNQLSRVLEDISVGLTPSEFQQAFGQHSIIFTVREGRESLIPAILKTLSKELKLPSRQFRKLRNRIFLQTEHNNLVNALDLSLYIESTRSSITSCRIINENGNTWIQTEGTDVAKVAALREVLTESIFSTCIKQMEEVFGIDVAIESAKAIVTIAFEEQGLQISPTQLSIIINSLTFTGTFLSINRFGIINTKGSLLRASFEQSLGVILKSAVKSEDLAVVSPLEKFLLGQRMGYGTDGFILYREL